MLFLTIMLVLFAYSYGYEKGKEQCDCLYSWGYQSLLAKESIDMIECSKCKDRPATSKAARYIFKIHDILRKEYGWKHPND